MLYVRGDDDLRASRREKRLGSFKQLIYYVYFRLRGSKGESASPKQTSTSRRQQCQRLFELVTYKTGR